MNKSDLLRTLQEEGIDADAYDLDGQPLSERYVLAQDGVEWCVFYAERGLQSGKRMFADEESACEHLLASLRKDPTTKKVVNTRGAAQGDPARGGIGDRVIIIGSLPDLASNQIVLQDFVVDGESFIPIFSDDEHFRAETRGSGLEDKGIVIERRILHSILEGHELLLLNPGSANPIRLRKADLV